MNEHDPVKLIQDENAARAYFLNIFWPEGVTSCLRCGHKKIYSLRRMRYRCRQCAYEFHGFSGLQLNSLRIPLRKWAAVLHCFEQEYTAVRTAEEAKLCYPTTLKAFAIIRRAIFVDVLLRKFGRGAEEKNIAFGAVLPAGAVLGVNLEKGIARIEEARNYWPGMTERLPMQSIRYGGICIASSSHTYDLLLYETNKTYLLPQDTASSTWENGSDELSLFVQFLKTRLLKKRRLGIGAFPLTVSEIIFRYNNIGTPLFKNLAELLAAQVEDDL